jgi:prephenate dehydratase
VKSRPGSLTDCLVVLKEHGIDMTKLESRPIAGKPWSYMFYVDAMLPEDRSAFDAAEASFREAAEDYRNLGRYRAG